MNNFVFKQECLRAGQEQLEHLWVEQDEQAHHHAEQRECRHREYERAEHECLAAQAQSTTGTQASLGSHTPVLDEHGEDLDYIHDVEQEEQNDDTWQCLIADIPINKELKQDAQAREQEAVLLEGPTQVAMPMEEEALLVAES